MSGFLSKKKSYGHGLGPWRYLGASFRLQYRSAEKEEL